MCDERLKQCRGNATRSLAIPEAAGERCCSGSPLAVLPVLPQHQHSHQHRTSVSRIAGTASPSRGCPHLTVCSRLSLACMDALKSCNHPPTSTNNNPRSPLFPPVIRFPRNGIPASACLLCVSRTLKTGTPRSPTSGKPLDLADGSSSLTTLLKSRPTAASDASDLILQREAFMRRGSVRYNSTDTSLARSQFPRLKRRLYAFFAWKELIVTLSLLRRWSRDTPPHIKLGANSLPALIPGPI
ncbi:hypothetical protein BCR34DRAFT_112489 [Clohesyomyces aquaticus]|uniref:Uncharacterized protein n=1 Tax=Clohesyomyces aquaticus TaxID=1231657 RepID=A0A1Y1YQZ2_9PLEO|nr:hypothetical protein BCR34DRAFT_112489 [Clohesyomyces aquaticus]